MNAATDLALDHTFPAALDYAPCVVSTPPLTPQQKARRYCRVLLLLPLFVIPSCIGLGRTDFFMHHGASMWVQSNDAVFNMRGRDCDVLIYGDSTAMTGIDPDVVERNTGLKTCNISVTNSVLAVTHNLTLNHFLANNVRPSLLLVQLSPDGFQPESNSWGRTVYPEGLVELLRHGSPAESRRVLIRHPREAIAFAGYAAGFTLYSLSKDAWYRVTGHYPEPDQVAIHNGFFTPPAPPSTSCEPGAIFSNPSAGGAYPRTVVDGFQNDYGRQTDVVLVNVAPIPACDHNLAAFRSELNGITSNPVLPLPVSLFNDPRHYTAVGSAVVSRLVAQQLNSIARQSPGIDSQPEVRSDTFTATAGNIASLQPARFAR